MKLFIIDIYNNLLLLVKHFDLVAFFVVFLKFTDSILFVIKYERSMFKIFERYKKITFSFFINFIIKKGEIGCLKKQSTKILMEWRVYNFVFNFLALAGQITVISLLTYV